jgi:DNA polymerase III delta prime subunit
MEEALLVEKYRPRTIDECILPESLKDTFGDILKSGDIPNMILSGGAGCGKTTVARALCGQLGRDLMFINASEDGGIDTLRTRIRQFASSVSLAGGHKVVILDEADYLNPSTTQPALRGFIEEFSGNCRFILTCNFKHRIIEPLHSRCTVIDFKIPPKEKAKMAKGFHARLEEILKKEEVKYEPAVLAQLIVKYFPDFRRVLNEIQRYSISGTIDAGILVAPDLGMDTLIKALKSKNFGEIRKWVVDNSDRDTAHVFRSIYDALLDSLVPSSIPQAILTLAEYQHRAAFAADQEINLAACCVSLAAECAFKT